MEKNDLFYLQDIEEATSKIEGYLKNVNFSMFEQEEMRQDAVIRQLEIIGEAANKLSLNFSKNHPDFPVKEAIRMRNFLIHGYDDVDIVVVWKTVTEDIPLLKKHLVIFVKKS